MESATASCLKVEDLRIHAVGPVNMAVAAGACVGISGPSGSGKSLFLRAVADMEPHQGTIRLDDTPQEQIPAPDWRRKVTLLPSESTWWFETVGEHFSDAAAVRLGAMGFEPRILGWPVSRLSSGERQRLALLRALAGQPRVLLLDEPTANLDEENTARVEDFIREYRIRTGATVLWISHQKSQLARVADRTFVISAGRWTETGRQT